MNLTVDYYINPNCMFLLWLGGEIINTQKSNVQFLFLFILFFILIINNIFNYINFILTYFSGILYFIYLC